MEVDIKIVNYEKDINPDSGLEHKVDDKLTIDRLGVKQSIVDFKKQHGPFSVGEEIEQYKIIEELGQGGMGFVYKGVHKNIERLAAIKVIALENLERIDFKRVKTEAEILSKVDNYSHCVRLYNSFFRDNFFFIIMEFIEGSNLRNRLEQLPGKPSAKELDKRLGIFAQVLDAMQYAHEHGVIHRDLKPENIMIEPNGNVKVIDFGLAFFDRDNNDVASSDGSTQIDYSVHSVICGTEAYMSPEQTTGSMPRV